MLLFLPGLICDARAFAPQLAVFPDSRAVDGYGTADSLEAMARVALDQAPETFDLFGHSMGGRIALEVVRLAPQRVRRLALASTGVHALGADEPAKRAALVAIGHERGFEALVDAWLPPMVADRNRADEALYGPMRQMCLDQGQAVFDAQIAALLGRPEQESLLPRIACPTLVITGELDSWSPPAQHRAIAAAIPGSTVTIVEGAGHMLPLEAPAAVNQAIADWLSPHVP
ncbi:MAG TPA: alpha/beta fold hydrolase [Croceibacterium sp.]|nr:alpha/beta fold hydrolase [Croceibacterium sp.]